MRAVRFRLNLVERFEGFFISWAAMPMPLSSTWMHTDSSVSALAKMTILPPSISVSTSLS